MNTDTHTCSDGARYRIDRNTGLIHHENWQEMPRRKYDDSYLDKYREIENGSRQMVWLRIGLLMPHVHRDQKLFELGYGLGHFLKSATDSGLMTDGFDRADPGGKLIRFCDHFTASGTDPEIFCAFDVIEHLPNPNLETNADLLFLSVPEAPGTWEEFEKWRHRRPDEHILHFRKPSMVAWLDRFGYRVEYMGNPEDAIRKGDGNKPNILTVIASR